MDHPYRLFIQLDATEEAVDIDLDESGWATTHAHFMRGAALWQLRPQGPNWPLVLLKVWGDEQPYYAARHTGAIGGGGSNEVIAYGLGVKNDRSVWALPGGVVCTGDDVNHLSEIMLYALGPRPQED